jgi:hypothetical protein
MTPQALDVALAVWQGIRDRHEETDRLRRQQEILGRTLRTANPGRARVVDAALQEPVDQLVDEAPPATVAAREPLLPQPLHLLVDALEQAV